MRDALKACRLMISQRGLHPNPLNLRTVTSHGKRDVKGRKLRWAGGPDDPGLQGAPSVITAGAGAGQGQGQGQRRRYMSEAEGGVMPGQEPPGKGKETGSPLKKEHSPADP